jgi:hypothetical protein
MKACECWEFLLEGTAIDIKGMLVDFVEHHNHGGTAAKALNQL